MKNNLKELLKERGLSVSEFSRQTGIPQPTMHRVVNGKVDMTSIKAEHFMRISHGLGLSAEQLYFGDMSYDEAKSTIDHIYATTCAEGRDAMLANALGIAQAYPCFDDFYLPTIREDQEALKGY